MNDNKFEQVGLAKKHKTLLMVSLKGQESAESEAKKSIANMEAIFLPSCVEAPKLSLQLAQKSFELARDLLNRGNEKVDLAQNDIRVGLTQFDQGPDQAYQAHSYINEVISYEQRLVGLKLDSGARLAKAIDGFDDINKRTKLHGLLGDRKMQAASVSLRDTLSQASTNCKPADRTT